MLNLNRPVGAPAQGYFGPNRPAASAPQPAPAAPTGGIPGLTPTPEPGARSRGLSAKAALDLGHILAHPIQTVASLVRLSRDVISLQSARGLTVASAAPALARYQSARQELDAAPFRHLLPFFERALDRWADARFGELRPEVNAQLSERAWHPVALEWPDTATGHDRLSELMMVQGVAEKASDGQIVRALMGANRLQFRNSTAVDYFYPVARANDALILRRNLPLVPGQKPMAETFQALLTDAATVQIQAL